MNVHLENRSKFRACYLLVKHSCNWSFFTISHLGAGVSLSAATVGLDPDLGLDPSSVFI